MTSQPPVQDFKYFEFLKLLSPEGKQDKVTVALFGLGQAGTLHLKNLLANTRVNLKYIIEAREERRNEIKNLLSGPLSRTSLLGIDHTDIILQDKELQAVVITTPTFTHKEIVKKSLDNGKAVMCEKPVAESYEEVQKCYLKAKKAGLPLFCSFNRRFEPNLDTMAKRVHAGEIGKVHVMKSVARDSPMLSLEYIKASPGFFHDSMIHDFDFICYTLGEFPSRVYAAAFAHNPEIGEINEFDTVTAQLTFPSGAMAVMDASRCAVYGYDQRHEVFGSKGMLQTYSPPTLALSTFKEGEYSGEPIHYLFPSKFEGSYIRALDHFIDVVQGKDEMLVTARETMNVSKVATAVEQSARTGVPVDIKYDD